MYTANELNKYGFDFFKRALQKNEFTENCCASIRSLFISILHFHKCSVNLSNFDNINNQETTKIFYEFLLDKTNVKFFEVIKNFSEIKKMDRIYTSKDLEQEILSLLNVEEIKLSFNILDQAVRVVNSWGKKFSDYRVEEIVKSDMLSQKTQFLLISIFDICPEWKIGFNQRETRTGEFCFCGKVKKIQMMRQTTPHLFFRSFVKKFSVLIKEFKTQDLIGIFICPDKGITLSTLFKDLTFEDIIGCVEKAEEVTTCFSLPKCEINVHFNASDLIKHGSNQQCKSSTDANSLNCILYSGLIKFQESYDSSQTSNLKNISKCIYFTLNKPFIFLVADKSSSTILISNAIINPS